MFGEHDGALPGYNPRYHGRPSYHPKGTDLLAGGDSGGQVYWELEAGNGTCILTADPATNGGKQAEVRIHTTGSTNNLDVDIEYTPRNQVSGETGPVQSR